MTTDLFRKEAPPLMAKLMADFAMTEEDAAAVLGNAGHESGGFRYMQELAPTSGRGGLGIFQWTGPRRVAFEAWLRRKGAKPNDYGQSYAFLFRELKTTERAAVPATKLAKGLYAKVVAFERAFERSGVKAYDSRFAWAQLALSAYQSAPVTVQPTEPAMADPIIPFSPIAPPKPWYLSKGVIGGVLAVVLPLLSVVFPPLKLVDPGTAADTILRLIEIAGPVIGGILAITGRLGAVQPIAGTQAAKDVAANTISPVPIVGPVFDAVSHTVSTLETAVTLLPTVFSLAGQLQDIISEFKAQPPASPPPA